MMYHKLSTSLGKILHVYFHLCAVSCVKHVQTFSGCAATYSKFPTSLGKMLHVYLYMHAMDECIVCMNSLIWTLVWLAPEATQNSEFICFHVLLQNIGQMVMVGPKTLTVMNE